MSEARRRTRKAKVRMGYLGELLGTFYTFLSGTPQPSNDEVRATFVKMRGKWRHYCKEKGLSDAAYDEFTRQVGEAWHRNRQEPH